MAIPQNTAFLERYIRRMFQSEAQAYQMRVMMAYVVIGQLLPSGVVRGGTSMKIRYGYRTTRFTMDFDTAQQQEIDEFRRQLSDSLAIGWAEFTGRIVPAPRAKSTRRLKLREEYLMTPMFVKLSYRRHPWCTVKLEVSPNEIGDADNSDHVPVPEEVLKAFVDLGFPEPKAIPVMTLEYQIAQKIHGMTKPGNVRPRDLVDLQIIAKHEKVPYKKVGVLCRRLFAYRQQQTWPSNVAYEARDWESAYREAAEGVDVLQTLEEAVPWGNNFIAKVHRYSRK